MDYSKFVGLYSLSKTLRFELRPTSATKKILDENNFQEIDKERHEKFKKAKKILDEVHRSFIDESLNVLELNSADLSEYIKMVVDKKEDKAVKKKVFSCFETAYKKTSNDWQLIFCSNLNDKEKNKHILDSNDNPLKIAREQKDDIARKLGMSAEDIEDTLKYFDKFSTYFKGYTDNRKNMYTVGGKATEIASRVIDQNLITFYNNIIKFEKFYKDKMLFPDEIHEYFKIENYSRFVTQRAIAEDYNLKIGELNSLINQERQKLNKKDKKSLPLFKVLYKQILGDTEKTVIFESIDTKDEYENIIDVLSINLRKWTKEISDHFNKNVKNINNPENVYLNKKAANSLLQKYISYESLPLVNSNLPEYFNKNKNKKGGEEREQFISVKDFLDAVEVTQKTTESSIFKDVSNTSIWALLSKYIEEKIETAKSQNDFDTSNKESVKRALDAFNDLFRVYTYFELRYKNQSVTSLDEDTDFYMIFNNENTPFANDKNARFSHTYDLIRNYLTKKPYSLNKWKLNFDCSILLGGWDLNKEPDKRGVLLRNGSHYYLAVIDGAYKDAFSKDKHPTLFSGSFNGWEKMEYKCIPGANKMLPKCLLRGPFRQKYNIPEEIDLLYKKGEYRKGENFNLNKLHKLIDFYKEALKSYEGWSMYDFKFKDTSSYEGIDQFYNDVDDQGYKLDFVGINYSELSKMEQSGQIYLFEIRNKDWSEKSKGLPNLHTKYFSNIFHDDNFKLNGEAEVFFRPRSIDLKSSKQLETEYEVIENKRFTEDKIFFHVPLTLNRKARITKNYPYNSHAFECIKSDKIDAIIGIDRGEKHLAYVAVVDREGRLLDDPISLNTVYSEYKNKKYEKNYMEKLAQCEKDRLEDRQNWDAVRRMKDLKDGYVGHCIKKIVDLMIKHNAIVVMEDLNSGFKQGRSKIERNVYNQLEQALLKKLQYVVNKSKKDDEIFGTQKGLQLSPPEIAPKDTSRHMGFVFYVDPSYTSAVDPITGYRQQVNLDSRINTTTFSKFIRNAFDEIRYEDDKLVMKFDWKGFANSQNSLGIDKKTKSKTKVTQDKKWQITLDVSRTVFRRTLGNKPESKIINPQVELLKAIKEEGIVLKSDMKNVLCDINKPSSKFVEAFIRNFNLANKLRNTIDGDDTITSPVYPNGFDSRKDKIDGMKKEWNGDANGAYNIARKGAILLNKLNEAENIKEFKCVVSCDEYDRFILS